MAAKKCLICNSPFKGRADAITCSPRCRKRLQQLRFSLAHSQTRGRAGNIIVLVLLGLFGFLSVFLSATPQKAQAITSSTNLNFQARLFTNSGAVVPDGNYNIDFKLYNTDNTTGTVGTCSGACVWEETHLVSASQGVAVVNGYFSVPLGAITAFSGINWDQQMFLTMNLTTNGTVSCTPRTSCTWDGEMLNSAAVSPNSKSIALTAVPLAFRANTLAVNNGTQTGTLSFGAVTNSPVITLPNETGTVCTSAATSTSNCTNFAPATGGSGYVQLQGTTPGTAQTGNFNISGGGAGVGIATTFQATNFDAATSNTAMNIGTSNAALVTLGNTTNSTFLVKTKSSTTAFQIQDSGSNSILDADSTNRFVGINNATPNATLDVLASSSSFTDGFESGSLSPFTTSAVNSSTWSTTNVGAHTGSFAATGTDTAGSGSTTLSLTKTLNSSGTVSFYAAYSNPQTASSWNFQIDGVTQTSSNTATGYTLYSFSASSGSHTFTWNVNTAGISGNTLKVDDVTVTNAGVGTAALFNGGNVGIGTSFPNTTLDVTGNVHIQASANSATEFQIQSATASDTLFTADTTNNKVVIGNSTGTNTNTTLLVIDSATADPATGFNGAMYYNSTNNVYRCYVNGAWANCGSNSVTLQNAYDNSSSPATITTSSSSKGILFKAGSGNDSSSLFQVQDSGGDSLLNIDSTTANTNNKIANPSFETAVSNWSALNGGSSGVQSGAQAYEGSKSLLIATNTTAGGGGSSYSTGAGYLASTTSYTLSAYVKTDSALPVTTFEIGRSDNGTLGGDTPCLTAQSLPVNGGWQRFSCTFTTGAASGSPYIYFKVTDNVNRNLYIDDVLLQTDAQAQNVYRNGSLSVSGTLISSPIIIQNNVNSSNALQINNAAGTQILAVSTNDTNLIADPGFETSLAGGSGTGWTANGANTKIRRDTSAAYSGVASLQVAITPAAAGGAQFNLNPVVTAAGTTYTVSFYIESIAGTVPTMQVTYDPTGSAPTTCNPSGTVVTGGWIRMQCTVSSATAPGTGGFIRIAQTNSAVATWNIDGVQMEAASVASAYGAGSIALNGTISTPVILTGNSASVNAFQVQNAVGVGSMFNVDTLNNRVTIGDADNTSSANSTLLVVDSGSTANRPTAVNGGIFYDSSLGHFVVVEGGSYKVLCNQTDAGCGSGGGSTTNLNQAYANGSISANQTLQLTSTHGGGVILQDQGTNSVSSTLFQVQNSSSNSILTVEDSGNTVNIGRSNGASGLNGELTFSNSSNNNLVGFQAGVTGTSGLIFTLPTADGINNQCLETDGAKNFFFGQCSGNGGGGVGNANKQLSNLSSVSVNSSLTPASNSTDLDTSSAFWNNAYFGGTVYSPAFDVATAGNAMGIGNTNAGAITIGNVTNSTVTVKTKASAAAFQVQNASSKALLTVDSSGNQVLLGTAGTGGIDGKLTLNTDTASAFAVSIASSSSTTASYTLTLPTALPVSNSCIQSNSGGTLSFVNCGAGATTTLSQAYTNGSAAGDQTLLLTSADGGGVKIQDASGGLGTDLFDVQSFSGTTTYLGVSASTISSADNLQFTAAAGATISTNGASGDLTVQATGTRTLALNTGGAGTVNLGTANTTTIGIGNTGAALTIESSATANLFNGNTAHNINIGSGGTSSNQVIVVGSTNSGSTTTIQGGTTGNGVSIGVGSGGNIAIGSNNANTVNIANGAFSNTVNIGNSTANTAVNLTSGGTGNLTFKSNSASTGTIVQSGTNSSAAFQVQNSIGAPVLLVDTTSTDNTGATVDYISNPGFEVGNPPTGWSAVNPTGGTTNLTQNNNKQHTYNGLFSASVAVTANTSGGGGLQTSTFLSAPPGSASYIVSFYAKISAGTIASNAFTVTTTGGGGSCSPAAGITINSSGFQRLFCTLAAGAGSVTNFKISDNVTTAHTLFIDSVQMQSTTYNGVAGLTTPTAYQFGEIQLRGVITNPLVVANNGDSTSAFQVQATSGNTVFAVDTLNAQAVLGTSSKLTGKLVFNLSGSTNQVSITSAAQGNNVAITIPADTNTSDNICLQSLGNCGAGSAGGNFLVQAPNSNTGGTAGANVVTPNAGTAGIVALTLNGTTNATSADVLDVNSGVPNAATSTNGIQFNQNSAGTTTNGLNITRTSGALTNGIIFNGTITTDITSAASRALNIQPGTNGALTLTGEASSVWQAAGTSSTLTITGGATSGTALTINSAGGATTGGVTVTSGISTAGASGSIIINSGGATGGNSGNISIDVGTSSGGTKGTITVGSTNASAITLGNSNESGSTQILGGTTGTAISIQAGTSGTIQLGSSNANTITLGSNNASTVFSTESGTAQTNLFNGNTAHTIQLGAGGTSTVQQITIGSASNTTSTISLQGGTGTTVGSEAVRLVTGNNGTTAGAIDIGNTTGAFSQAINIGTNATASSSTTVTIGSTIAGTVNLQPAGGVNLGINNSQTGKLIFNTSAGTSTATITLAGNNATNSYVYQLPTAAVASNQCLQSGTVSGANVPLLFGSCSGITPTLQQVYNASTSQPQITLNSSPGAGGLIISDNATPLSGNLFTVQANGTSATPYLNVNSSNLTINDNTDNTGYLNTPFGGLGQYSNLLLQSEAFNQSSSWTPNLLSIINANTTVSPDGNQTAETLSDSAGGGKISQTISTTATGNYTFSVWLKATSVSLQNVDLRIDSSAATGTVKTVVATPVWQRFSVTQNLSAALTSVTVNIFPGQVGGVITGQPLGAWGAQLVTGTSTQVYIRTVASTVPSSTTGLYVSGNSVFSPVADSGTAFQIQNASSSNLFNADSVNMRIGVDVTYSSMGTAFGTVTVTDAGAGSLTSGSQYFYKITAIDSLGGETTASTEGTLGTGHTALNVAWTAISGASGYKVYRSTTTNTEVYYTTVLTNSFKDTGQFTAGTATVPGSNTAVTSLNNSNKLGQITVGGLGTPTGQVYISGITPTLVGTSNNGLSGSQYVFVQGRYAYVTSSTNNKFSVFDVSNAAAPALVGSTTSGLTDVTHVFVQGHYAYVIGRSVKQLYVIDISNPAVPSLVSTLSTGASALQSLYVQGRYAFLSVSAGIMVVDISSPASPQIISSYSAAGMSNTVSLFVQGRYAYVLSNGNNTLYVVDVSNPSNPTSVGSTNSNLGSSLPDIYVQGRYAYIADAGTKKIDIVDVSNASSPTYVGSSSAVAANIFHIFVQGRYLYAVDNSSATFYVYDISNPTSPLQMTSTSSGLSTAPGIVYVQGRYAYVTDFTNNSLNVYDLGGEYTQQLEAGGAEFGTLGVDSNATFASDVSIQGGASIGGPTQINDDLGVNGSVNIQGSASLNATYSILSAPTQNGATVTASGGSLAIANYFYKITAIDSLGGESLPSNEQSGNVTVTNSKVTLSWVPVAGASAYKIYRSTSTNTEVYMVTTEGVVTGANLTYVDLGSIAPSGSGVPTSASARQYTNTSGIGQLVVGGLGSPTGQVYISGNAPTSVLDSYKVVFGSSNFSPYGMAIEGRYGFFSSNLNGIYALDVSNPAAVTTISSSATNCGDSGNAVAVQGTYVYAAGAGGKFMILDATNPAAMVCKGSLTFSTDNLSGLYVTGHYAYVTDSTANMLYIIDITNPSAPSLVGSISSTLSGPAKVVVQGRYAYVISKTNSTLFIFDVSNPADPTLAATASSGLSTVPGGLYVQGAYVYVGSNNGLVLYGISNPTVPTVAGSLTLTYSPTAVFVQGRYAYISDSSNNKFGIVDVSNPQAPVLDNTLSVSGVGAYNLAVSGRYAYISNTSTLVTLDLGGLYTQQLEAGGAQVGTLNVDGNSTLAGDLQALGGASFGQGLQVGGNIAASGAISVQGGLVLGGGKNQLGPVAGLALGTAGAGSLTGVYRYEVDAVDAYGNEGTMAGTTEVTTASLTANNMPLTWTALAGASGYKVYRTAAGGGIGTEKYLASTNTNSYTDAGTTALSSINPPANDLTGQFTDLGSALFRSSSNSATAFQFQNSGAQNIFTIDTSNNRVQIGSSTANASNVVLVLNNSSAASGSEPTEVDGAMYWNSNINQFRCGVKGAWENCGGLLIANTATASCTNTVTPTSCTPNDSFTAAAPSIPANYCLAGRIIHVHAAGIYSGQTTASSLTFSVRLAGTIIGAAGTAATGTVANMLWNVDFYITCDSTTTVTGEGIASVWATAAGNAATGQMTGTGTTTVTNTGAQAITLFVNVGATADFTSITLEQFIVQGM